MNRLDQLKQRIFDLNNAEKAELKILMEKRNADPERIQRLATQAVIDEEQQARIDVVCRKANEEEEARGERLSQYIASLRRENVYLGNEWGDVPTWAIPEGVELGNVAGDCRLCGQLLHYTRRGMTVCKYGHWYDVTSDRMSMRKVIEWLSDPKKAAGGEATAAALEWAILGRER